MDHRITVVVVAVFGGTLAFTFLVASVTSSVKPEAARAALVGEDADAEEANTGPSPREQLAQVLQRLDRSTEQWRRDHDGREPDFESYPAWEQFLRDTSADGKPGPGATRRPYLPQAPVNPLNQLNTVMAVDNSLRVADRVPAEARVGFVYSRADRCYWGTNGSARIVLVRGTEPATRPVALPPTTAPATAPTTSATTAPTIVPTPAPAIAEPLPEYPEAEVDEDL